MKKHIFFIIMFVVCLGLGGWRYMRSSGEKSQNTHDSTRDPLIYAEKSTSRYVSGDDRPSPGGPVSGMDLAIYAIDIPHMQVSFEYTDFFPGEDEISQRLYLSGEVISIDRGYARVSFLAYPYGSGELLQRLHASIAGLMQEDCTFFGKESFLTGGDTIFNAGSTFLDSTRYQTFGYDWEPSGFLSVCPFMNDELTVVTFIYDTFSPGRILVLTLQDGVAPAPDRQRIETLDW